MLIAVASKSGREVDQHFGQAERFLIYDYRGGAPRAIREVAVDKYCTSDPGHSFHVPRFAAIARALDGCRAVVTEMIGELPKDALQKAGITAVVTSGPIGPALTLAHDSVCVGPCSGAADRRDCPHR